ncbi:hypothetical protein PoMZ_13001, partial [Pyricularia oryzae]
KEKQQARSAKALQIRKKYYAPRHPTRHYYRGFRDIPTDNGIVTEEIHWSGIDRRLNDNPCSAPGPKF